MLRVFGIQISVGASWLIVLLVYLFLLTPYFHSLLGGGYTAAYLLTVLGVLGFFASLVAHELGHALVARHQGVEVVGIELWALGGLTKTRLTKPLGPWKRLAVAAAGPAVNAAIAVFCLGVGAAAVGGSPFLRLAVGETAGHPGAGAVFLAWLGTVNVLLLALNLLPAYPLDGAQILQSLLAALSGNQAQGLRATGRIGQLVGLAAGVAAFYLILHGYPSGLFLLLLGLFLFQSATVAANQGEAAVRISHLTVGQLLDRHPLLVPAELPVLEAWERYFEGHAGGWYPVADPQHRFLGAVSGKRLQEEIAAGRPALAVAEVAEGARELAFLLRDDGEPVEGLLRSEGIQRWGGLVAVDSDGVVQGILTLSGLQAALRS